MLFFTESKAATNRDTSVRRYLGFDANPLLSQVLPFNRINVDANVFAITRRNYWGNNGIRASYGVGLGTNLDIQFLQFSFGYDHRRSISKNWRYFGGVDFILRALDDFAGTSRVNIANQSGLGFAGHWGVEYQLGKIVSLSTEAALQFLLIGDFDAASLILQPPINLTAHFNITKK